MTYLAVLEMLAENARVELRIVKKREWLVIVNEPGDDYDDIVGRGRTKEEAIRDAIEGWEPK